MPFFRIHRALQRRASIRVGYAVLLINTLLLLISVGGCSGKKRLAVFPVNGRVTYGGQGVPHAVVIFVPTGDTVEVLKKMRPFAYADVEGNFKLKTYVDDDGAPSGKYRVCIVAAPGRPSASRKDGPVVPPSPATGSVNIPAAVSKKYGSADTSGLEATVIEGENNLEPFVLSAGGTT